MNTNIKVVGIKNSDTHLCIGSKHRGKYVYKEDIVYVEAQKSYSWIYLKNGSRYLSTKPIGYFEGLFSEVSFYRIHRSYLVNLKYLKCYEPNYRLVHLFGENILPVSYRKNRHMSREINQYQTQSA